MCRQGRCVPTAFGMSFQNILLNACTARARRGKVPGCGGCMRRRECEGGMRCIEGRCARGYKALNACLQLGGDTLSDVGTKRKKSKNVMVRREE